MVGPDDFMVQLSLPQSNRDSADYNQAVLNGYLSAAADSGVTRSFEVDGTGYFLGRDSGDGAYSYNLEASYAYQSFGGESINESLDLVLTSNGKGERQTLESNAIYHQNISASMLAGVYDLMGNNRYVIRIHQNGSIVEAGGECSIQGQAQIYDERKNLVKVSLDISGCANSSLEGLVVKAPGSNCPARNNGAMNAISGILPSASAGSGFLIVNQGCRISD